MGRTFTGQAYLDEDPETILAMAHRGGAEHPDLIGLENTRFAFAHAAHLGYRYLETDVHATSDGVLLAFHDPVLDRVTDQRGAVAERSAAEIARARIGGEHGIPTLAELLDAFPECRFNVDLKADAAVVPMVDLLATSAAADRVCVGSFSGRRLRRFRRLTERRVATSASPVEVALFLLLPARIARFWTRGLVRCLQVPRKRGPLPIVTRRFVSKAREAGAQVHVWTVDDPTEMNALIDLGVDGLITDRTDLLKDVLIARGLWSQA